MLVCPEISCCQHTFHSPHLTTGRHQHQTPGGNLYNQRGNQDQPDQSRSYLKGKIRSWSRFRVLAWEIGRQLLRFYVRIERENQVKSHKVDISAFVVLVAGCPPPLPSPPEASRPRSEARNCSRPSRPGPPPGPPRRPPAGLSPEIVLEASWPSLVSALSAGRPDGPSWFVTTGCLEENC